MEARPGLIVGGPCIALAMTLVACSEATVADVSIDAQACAIALAERLVVSVSSGDGTEAMRWERRVAQPDPEVSFPTGVRVVPRDGDASRAWIVDATLVSADDVVLSHARARGGYVEGETTRRDLILDDACIGIECLDGQTCVDGECRSELEARGPPAYTRATCPPILFVDGADGVDGGDCATPAAPCRTIQFALDLTPMRGVGRVVFVHGGRTYTSDSALIVLDSEDAVGGEGAPIVVRAWPGTGTPTLEVTGTGGAAMHIDAENVVIDGLAARGALEHGIRLNGNSATGRSPRNVTVRRCDVSESGRGPSMFDNRGAINLNNGATNILIEGCRLHHNRTSVTGERAMGLYINGSHSVRIFDNVIEENDKGIHVSSNTDVVVRHNRITDSLVSLTLNNTSTDFSDNRVCNCGGVDPAVIVSGEPGISLTHNTIVDNPGHGIQVNDRAGVLLRDNIVAFHHQTGIYVTAPDVDDSYNLYFGNGTDLVGFTPDAPDTDLFVDPLVGGREDCSLVLGAGSRALGAASDGTDRGAR